MSITFSKKVPNLITLSRMVGAAFMVLYYYFGESYKFEILWIIFSLAGISDFLDGYLSRKWNVTSNLGKCLDPISDKLLLITSLLILVHARVIDLIIAFILMGREIII
jgi:CDP-diacylglycerol--glycerol-3-phosphate 3-phosphatidyltransferase